MSGAVYLAGFLAAAGANRNTVPAGVALPAPDTPAARSPEISPVVSLPARTFEERVKHELHPLDAFHRLLDCSNVNRPPGADDQFRFRWFGLFYQGPWQDAFLLRVRLSGGRLRAFQLVGLAGITQELAGGCVVCNAQGGIDIPGVPVRAAAEILRRVEEIGLRTLLSGGDCVQTVRGGEHEGLIEPSRPPTIYPLVRELEQALALNRRLSDLPRGCQVILRGVGEALALPLNNESQPEAMVFQADAVDPAGFFLNVPGASGPGWALATAQVVPACLELLRLWAEHGDRSDRQRAGLADFCAGIGSEPLRARLAQTVGPLSPAPLEAHRAPAATRAPLTGVPVTDGRLLSEDLTRLAEAARVHGPGEVRLAAGHLSLAPATDEKAAGQALRNALHRP